MGRANVYLPDDLERRVKAARIPVSEVCQQALLAAVEEAEAVRPRLAREVAEQYARGRDAGDGWARSASVVDLLALVRDHRLDRIPAERLPENWYAFGEEFTTAWEAGFADGARAVARATVERLSTADPSSTERVAEGAEEAPAVPVDEATDSVVAVDEAVVASAGEAVVAAEPALGDGSTSWIGVDHSGRRVAFDPHAAVREGKSPLFAVLGPAEQRARLALSVGQDAACRGGAVVMVDLSGQLTPRARGLGRIVRVPSTVPPTMPGLDALLGGELGGRGLFDLLAGLSSMSGGLFPAGGSNDLVAAGYVTVLPMSGEGPLGGLSGAMNAVRALGELTTTSAHGKLLLVDLPTGVAVPGPLAAALGRLVRTARQNDVALGLSAESAEAVADVGGSGALLSTVFAFPTSSPAEADHLRDLLGASAPILVNPPGFVPRAEDEVWCTMRDLAGRLGQVRLEAG